MLAVSLKALLYGTCKPGALSWYKNLCKREELIVSPENAPKKTPKQTTTATKTTKKEK